MKESNFIFQPQNVLLPEQSSYTWRAPSNIALVKYWGKTSPQLPKNPSISFTLDACFTLTTVDFIRKKKSQDFKDGAKTTKPKPSNVEFYFEGKNKPDFLPKITAFIKAIYPYASFLLKYDLKIHSRNSFPHSSGIASSASGMAALALCIMSLERELNGTITEAYFKQKASFLARLGSGSASRSIDGGVMIWGEHQEIKGSSNLYALPVPFKVHANYKNYRDTILLVDRGAKKVSSSLGHRLMIDHPFAAKRFSQANSNLSKLKTILQNGNLNEFIELVESEALTLHAMMMCSKPYFILMKPNTLKIIEKIWDFRAKTNSKLCFTLDAGANVHLLFPEKETESVNLFIIKELIQFCQNNDYICDSVGSGPKQM